MSKTSSNRREWPVEPRSSHSMCPTLNLPTPCETCSFFQPPRPPPPGCLCSYPAPAPTPTSCKRGLSWDAAVKKTGTMYCPPGDSPKYSSPCYPLKRKQCIYSLAHCSDLVGSLSTTQLRHPSSYLTSGPWHVLTAFPSPQFLPPS